MCQGFSRPLLTWQQPPRCTHFFYQDHLYAKGRARHNYMQHGLIRFSWHPCSHWLTTCIMSPYIPAVKLCKDGKLGLVTKAVGEFPLERGQLLATKVQEMSDLQIRRTVTEWNVFSFRAQVLFFWNLSHEITRYSLPEYWGAVSADLALWAHPWGWFTRMQFIIAGNHGTNRLATRTRCRMWHNSYFLALRKSTNHLLAKFFGWWPKLSFPRISWGSDLRARLSHGCGLAWNTVLVKPSTTSLYKMLNNSK